MYDPRLRPWYTGSKQRWTAGGGIQGYSGVYTFSTMQTLGITAQANFVSGGAFQVGGHWALPSLAPRPR